MQNASYSRLCQKSHFFRSHTRQVREHIVCFRHNVHRLATVAAELATAATSFLTNSGAIWAALASCLFCLSGIATQAGEKEEPALSDQVTPDDISAWLKEVPLKIRRRGILPEEAETYYQVLGYARDVDTKLIKQAAERFLYSRWKESKSQGRAFEEFPVYVDIYRHPELYQGRPVIMSGHVQRTVKSKAAENNFGIDTICEAWLYTDDSQSNPTVVVSTSFPDRFPIGEQVIDHVTVTGYIYRMYTYDARDARRFAPLLIAHEIKWTPVSDAERTSSRFWGMLIIITGILVVGALLGLFFLIVAQKKTRSRKNVAEMLEEISPPCFETKQNHESGN